MRLVTCREDSTEDPVETRDEDFPEKIMRHDRNGERKPQRLEKNVKLYRDRERKTYSSE